MPHCTPEQLALAALRERLPETDTTHLAVCAECRAEVDAQVLVIDAAGGTTRWRVVSRVQVDKQALPVDRLFARAGPPRLVLITCGGEFLPEVGGYESNVVVVAEPLP